jgi:peptide-methionine (S)-S-oxide reductase
VRALLAALLVAASAAACHAEAPAAPPEAPAASASAVFAGGCFWCMEPPFDGLDGVLSTTSGYTGGSLANPTYEQVTAGGTGHVEAVKVVYDPKRVDYAKLLDVYWRNIDPLDGGGQFCDRGESYRSAIFAGDDEERRLAEASKDAISKQLGKPVATTTRDAAPFYPAEEYHQDYYRKNPIRYRYYRGGCGRDARLEEVWGKAAAQDH